MRALQFLFSAQLGTYPPNASAFAEVKAFVKPAKSFRYSRLRFTSCRWKARHKQSSSLSLISQATLFRTSY